MDKILASDGFRRAERQCRFLRYIVEHRLAGTTDRLKGYTIGLDVFDREPSFDPNLDSIVRVEAGRLRTKLREYYQGSGRDDAIYIDLARGSYAPSISRMAARAEVAEKRGKRAAVRGSIAVLPFRNLSGDPEQEYFSDGLTDTVITTLAGNRHLKVISLTSTMRYKKAECSVPDIADDLNVAHIVEGTVVRDGSRVRVSAQLIEAATDHHVWAEVFERDMTGVIRVQRDLADVISAQLIRELVPAGTPEFHSPVNPDAYEMYLLGRGYRRRMTRESIEKAAQCFKKAISLDMNFAAAYSGAASCYCALGSYGFELDSPERIIPAGLEYSRRAMELDHGQVEPIVFTAIMVLKYEWKWPEAEHLFKAALAVSLNDTRSHLQYSLYFESLGDFHHAIDEAEQARQVDPLSTEANMNLAWQLHQAGRDDEAQSRLLWTLDLDPDFWAAHWGLGHVHLAAGRHREAIESFRRSADTGAGYTMPLQGLGYAHAVSGDRAAARSVLDQLEDLGRTGYVSPCCLAAIHSGLGDADRCFEYLDRAFRLRSRSMAWLNVMKEFAPVRSDPRFTDLVRRIGIPDVATNKSKVEKEK
ncbi:MAG: tetratricopeptide repeat protein [Gammaproteobacteria bacterium]|nr:tetratricopeptide repeat protein [Gammaproteobacteria bacterium]